MATRINAYKKIKKRNETQSTVNYQYKLVAIRAFLYFLYENGYVQEKIKVRKLKTDTKILKLFTEEDIQKIIERPNLEKCMTNFYDLSTLVSIECDIK